MDERIPLACERSLEKRGFSVIKLPPAKELSSAVKSHTDMLIFFHNNTLITSRQYFSENAKTFEQIQLSKDINIILSDEEQLSEYPKDRIFNCLAVGSKFFAKTEYLSKEIVSYCTKNNIELIPTNQGYPACVTLAVGNLAITSDAGMANTLQREGITPHIIDNSEKIKLPPYKFGFIGGSAGVYDNTVYFIGNLLSHPNGEEIEELLYDAGYSCVSLDEESDSLFDMGGIIFLGAAAKNTAESGKNTNPKTPRRV